MCPIAGATNQTATSALLSDTNWWRPSGDQGTLSTLSGMCSRGSQPASGHGLPMEEVADTLAAESAEVVSGVKDHPVMPANSADGPGPSATVADALSLPS